MKSFVPSIWCILQAVLCLLSEPSQGHKHGRSSLSPCGVKDPSPEEIFHTEKQISIYKNSLGKDALARKVDRSQTNYEIEVFWYVFHLADGTGDVSDESIEKAMAVLNEVFAGIVEGTENSFSPCEDNDDYNLISFEYGETHPTPFTFTLNSITRVEVTEAEFNQDTDEGEAKMDGIRENSGEDCTKAFIFTGESDIRSGDSSYPQWCQDYFDGDHLFLHYEKLVALDDDNDYDYQIKTLVHYLGHWLGLYHTYSRSDECPGEGDDECRFNDAVLDTPAMKGGTYGCPVGRDSCPNSPGFDAIHSYMDSSAKCCQYLFTPNQIERMVLFTEFFRFGIGDAHPDFDDDYTLYYLPDLDGIETIHLCDVWTLSPSSASPSPDPASPTSFCDNITSLFDLIVKMKQGVVGV